MTYGSTSPQIMSLNQSGCPKSSVFCNDGDALDNSAVVTYAIHIDNSFNLPISGTG
jgi:hypothetical protein